MFLLKKRSKKFTFLFTVLLTISIINPIPNNVLAASTGVSNFVTRLYQQCLGRSPDTSGLNYWVNGLNKKTVTGASTAENFIFSQEFVKKNVSNDQFLNIMYASFFNRQADASGKAYWNTKLVGGDSRRYVLANFVNSNEFNTLCASYSITRGNIILTKPADVHPDVALFVYRFYDKCLGRAADDTGLNFWVTNLTSAKSTAADLSLGFVSSAEFSGKNLSNKDYVAVMYKVFFGRDADSSGQSYWESNLNSGYSKRYVLSNFVASKEFKTLCSSYGINTGTISTTSIDLPLNEEESNNTLASANTVNLNSDFKGNLKDLYDVDYYKFKVPASGKVTLNFKHALVDSGTWSITILDANNKELQNSLSDNTDINKNYDNIRLPTGYYYVKIQDYNYSNAKYTFNLNYTAENQSYEKEFNDTLTTSENINLNNNYTGNMNNSSDVDYYKFTLSTPGKLSLNFKHALVDDGSWSIKILDANTNSLQDSVSSNLDTNVTYDNIRLPAGNYYIKIEMYYYTYNNADYTFNLNYKTENQSYEKEFNDTLTSSTSISPNINYTGNMQDSSDVDYYKFSLATNRNVSLNFKHNLVDSGEWIIRILNADTDELSYLTSSESDLSINSDTLALPAGNYYVKISTYYSLYYNNDDYNFTVNLK